MDFDLQMAFNILLAVCGFALGGLTKTIWDTLKELRRDMHTLSTSVNKIEDKLPETYMRRDDFSQAVSRLEAAMVHGFDRIEKRIDGKADK